MAPLPRALQWRQAISVLGESGRQTLVKSNSGVPHPKGPLKLRWLDMSEKTCKILYKTGSVDESI